MMYHLKTYYIKVTIGFLFKQNHRVSIDLVSRTVSQKAHAKSFDCLNENRGYTSRQRMKPTFVSISIEVSTERTYKSGVHSSIHSMYVLQFLVILPSNRYTIV